MSDPFLAEIRWVGFNFAPRGWAICAGQLMAISQNTALFSLLGVNYGGDGRVTFGLPNLQGRVALGSGQGPGLSNYVLGELGGTETVTLLSSEMPSHSHTPVGNSSGDLSNETPVGNVWGADLDGGIKYYGSSANSDMAANAITPTGGGAPHSNMMPSLALNPVIAMQGIFPQRS